MCMTAESTEGLLRSKLWQDVTANLRERTFQASKSRLARCLIMRHLRQARSQGPYRSESTGGVAERGSLTCTAVRDATYPDAQSSFKRPSHCSMIYGPRICRTRASGLPYHRRSKKASSSPALQSTTMSLGALFLERMSLTHSANVSSLGDRSRLLIVPKQRCAAGLDPVNTLSMMVRCQTSTCLIESPMFARL